MNRASVIACRALLGAAFVLCALPVQAQTSTENDAAALRASSCSSCHGADGNSPSDKAPRLNGQSAGYLRSRLISFRYPIKESPRAIHTMGIAGATLSDGVIAALARFYAAQSPPAPGPQANPIGAVLYKKGAKDIPACQSCHGANGEGGSAAPRLAGQHKAYLLEQLSAFTIAARIADPMNHHVWVMTDQQAQAVAAYLGN
jgi:cytochrome c553